MRDREAWECESCGRVEAPQPCIGVCVRPPTRMVRADAHDGVIARQRAARRELEPLASLLRRLAWATPHDGQWECGLAALRAQADALAG